MTTGGSATGTLASLRHAVHFESRLKALSRKPPRTQCATFKLCVALMRRRPLKKIMVWTWEAPDNVHGPFFQRRKERGNGRPRSSRRCGAKLGAVSSRLLENIVYAVGVSSREPLYDGLFAPSRRLAGLFFFPFSEPLCETFVHVFWWSALNHVLKIGHWFKITVLYTVLSEYAARFTSEAGTYFVFPAERLQTTQWFFTVISKKLWSFFEVASSFFFFFWGLRPPVEIYFQSSLSAWVPFSQRASISLSAHYMNLFTCN